jgi:hypothetical protein
LGFTEIEDEALMCALFPNQKTNLKNCDVGHKDKRRDYGTPTVAAGVASEDTPAVDTGHACEALDGCSQPEGFDSPILRTTVQPNWDLEIQSVPLMS